MVRYCCCHGVPILTNLHRVEKVPLASNADLANTSFANPMVNWFIDNVSTEYERLRASFKSFFAPHPSLFVHMPAALPYLPAEIAEMIFSRLPEDHITLSKLCRVCRSWNISFSEDYKWQPLYDVFDDRTMQLANERVAAKYPHLKGKMKILFREVYQMMPTAHTKHYCQHCNDMHERVTDYKERDKAEDEAYWGRCACPKCVAGSWSTCGRYNVFLFERV